MLRLFIFLTALLGTATFSTDKKIDHSIEQEKTLQCKSLLDQK